MKARWLLMATLGALVVGMMALAGTAWAVPDGTPPTVVGTNPANGATNVDVDAKIRVKFSEQMKDRSINPTNIYITVGEGTETRVVPATVDYVDEITPVRAVLKPTEPLLANTVYTVVVEGRGDGDMKAVKDASGTPLASDTSSPSPPPKTQSASLSAAEDFSRRRTNDCGPGRKSPGPSSCPYSPECVEYELCELRRLRPRGVDARIPGRKPARGYRRGIMRPRATLSLRNRERSLICGI